MADGQVAAILRALAELAPGDRTARGRRRRHRRRPAVPVAWARTAIRTRPVRRHGIAARAAAAIAPAVATQRPRHGSRASTRSTTSSSCSASAGCSCAVAPRSTGGPRRICMPLVSRPVRMRTLALQRLRRWRAWASRDGARRSRRTRRRYDREVWGTDPTPALVEPSPPMRELDRRSRAGPRAPPDRRGARARRRRPEEARRGPTSWWSSAAPSTSTRRRRPPLGPSSLLAWADDDGHRGHRVRRGLRGRPAWPGRRAPGSTWCRAPAPHRRRRRRWSACAGRAGHGRVRRPGQRQEPRRVRRRHRRRGPWRSVLVVTPTPYAADVLGELLARQPGPSPCCSARPRVVAG